MRERYPGNFESVSRDSTAKEMLHCFALAYFAVCKTKSQKPSIDGLIDALCQDSYQIYDKYISYPLISAQLGETQKKNLKSIHTALPLLTSSILSTLEELNQLKKKISPIKRKKVDARTKQDIRALESFSKKQEILTKRITNFKNRKSNLVASRATSRSLIQNKLYVFSGNNASAISWVKSAFWTAQVLVNKNIIRKDYTEYMYCHSTSYHVRLVKDIPLTHACLRIIATNGIDTRADMINPADIYVIKISLFKSIIDSYEKETDKIITGKVSNAASFNSLTHDLIVNKNLIPISLKKSTSENPTAYLTGTTRTLPPELDQLVDEYTQTIEYFSSINEPTKLKKTIENLITINKIDYKHTNETFAVNFSFNYSILSNEIPKFKHKILNQHYSLVTASMTWNALPTNAEAKVNGAYTGGAGFSLVADVLRKYPTTRTIFNQIISKRKTAFIAAMAAVGISVSNNQLPRILDKQTIINEASDQEQIKLSINSLLPNNLTALRKNYVYGLYLVTLNVLLLDKSIVMSSKSDEQEIKEIKTALGQFAVEITNKKIESLLPTPLRNAYNYGLPTQTDSQKRVVKHYSAIKQQENRVAKLEALWFFMSGGRNQLNHYYKKQIAMTIYGLITKKGSKIFRLEPDGIYESGDKAGQKKHKSISDALGFKTTPYYLIGNSD